MIMSILNFFICLDSLGWLSCIAHQLQKTGNFQQEQKFVHFVGLESNECLWRLYSPESFSVNVVRLSDFNEYKSGLSSIATLLDGLSHQSELHNKRNSYGHAEEVLHQVFNVCFPLSVAKGNSRDPILPRTFKTAILEKNWRTAIDRGYCALQIRNTSSYVHQSEEMNVLPSLGYSKSNR